MSSNMPQWMVRIAKAEGVDPEELDIHGLSKYARGQQPARNGSARRRRSRKSAKRARRRNRGR